MKHSNYRGDRWGDNVVKVKVLIDNITKNDLISEWGLSFYIEYNGHRILLDTGASGAFADNAQKLGVDLEKIEYGVLSHAHYDHADGMPTFFEKNKTASFYLRKGVGENCYGKKNRFFHKYNGIKKGTLSTYADRIVYVEGDYELMEGVYLIPHKTPGLERIAKKVKLFVKDNGRMYPDDFAHEQSLVFDTPEGLVIFNSCSHGGADNIINEVAATFPEKNIRALVGGLHLYKSPEEDVRELAHRTKETGITKVITGHCTGDEAFLILKKELGDAVEQIYTGMEFEF